MAFIPHLVIVTPNIVDDNPADDTLTVRRDKHDGDWLGRLPRGFVCKAAAEYVLGDKRFYKLVRHVTAFPFTVEAGLQIWGNAAYLPEYVPGEPDPDPEPIPVTGDIWRALVLEIGRAIVRVMEG